MIAEGRHKAKAIEWKLGITKGGGEQIGVLFELEDRSTIPWFGYFTEKTVERTLESLEFMGWDGVDISNPKGLNTNDVQIVIEHERSESDGKTYARVRWVNRLGGGLKVNEELTGGALMSFRERMAGAVMARKQNKGASPRPVTSRRNDFGSPPDDDDIPF